MEMSSKIVQTLNFCRADQFYNQVYQYYIWWLQSLSWQQFNPVTRRHRNAETNMTTVMHRLCLIPSNLHTCYCCMTVDVSVPTVTKNNLRSTFKCIVSLFSPSGLRVTQVYKASSCASTNGMYNVLFRSSRRWLSGSRAALLRSQNTSGRGSPMATQCSHTGPPRREVVFCGCWVKVGFTAGGRNACMLLESKKSISLTQLSSTIMWKGHMRCMHPSSREKCKQQYCWLLHTTTQL